MDLKWEYSSGGNLMPAVLLNLSHRVVVTGGAFGFSAESQLIPVRSDEREPCSIAENSH